MIRPIYRLLVPLLLLTSPAVAQLGLPGVSLPSNAVGHAVGAVTRGVEPVLADAGRTLAAVRETRLNRLVRASPKQLELTRDGYLARRGEVLLFAPNAIALDGLRSLGFRMLGEEAIDGLDVTVTRMELPTSVRMRDAAAVIERVAPGLEWAPDHIYELAGRAGSAQQMTIATPSIATRVGVIDGAPGNGIAVAAIKDFASGAPVASNHGSAIVALLRRAGVRTIAVADVYGTDPAGGNALAIARGLGWLVAGGAKVITISLVGPDNPLLSRAITAARGKGVVIVAAVGNDGPAAPPAYPASYPGVVAVTAVDGRNRALIEAGRALHLDYAAPGADLTAPDARGRTVKLRGTSFAAPLAAARIAAAERNNWQTEVDKEAADLGKKGPDSVYGRGLLCEKCR
jgi:hypothetical protein